MQTLTWFFHSDDSSQAVVDRFHFYMYSTVLCSQADSLCLHAILHATFASHAAVPPTSTEPTDNRPPTQVKKVNKPARNWPVPGKPWSNQALAVGKACMARFWPTPGFKGRAFVSSGFSTKEETLISKSAVWYPTAGNYFAPQKYECACKALKHQTKGAD